MQGFNMGRYYPPDASNPPTFNSNSHPLGKRASKITQGILTVRFELPFAVWCTTCKPEAIVGQGVRFNAEKKKVGNYYSTPIWSFRMKHTACGGWWEIRTDPQKSEYVVVEGARRREYGTQDVAEMGEDGELRVLTADEREKRREDAFAGLEGKLEEKGLEKKNRERVEELYEKSEVWRDPYDVNARLRKEFRGKRKVWKKEEKHKEGMQDKFSLGIDIVDESETDRARAKLVDFGNGGENGGVGENWKPLFDAKDSKRTEETPRTKKLKSEVAAEKSRQNLQRTLVGNSKMATDPFLMQRDSSNSRIDLGLLKRKRTTEETPNAAPPNVAKIQKQAEEEEPTTNANLTTSLVAYDSD